MNKLEILGIAGAIALAVTIFVLYIMAVYEAGKP